MPLPTRPVQPSRHRPALRAVDAHVGRLDPREAREPALERRGVDVGAGVLGLAVLAEDVDHLGQRQCAEVDVGHVARAPIDARMRSCCLRTRSSGSTSPNSAKA